MKEALDPICGMKVNIKKAKDKKLFFVKNGGTHYFCSKKCKNKFENPIWYQSKKFEKIFPAILGVTLFMFTILSIIFDFMLTYMGIFFILFSLMKMPDWKGFVEAFKTYDIPAKYIPGYAWIYPGLELGLGLSYITGNFITIVAWITLIVMGVGAIGVSIKLAKKEKFQCACLGTVIHVPLTKITLLEDILMFLMASFVLFF